jgi:MSHA biogenesis protein MshE
VVMRLLDQSGGILNFDQLGMPKNILERVRRLSRYPNGMILVTGPTGSGKTTTLYATLSELNKPETKIITVEDPVEYRLPRINQVQIHEKIGLSFASVLRTALRQDPDVVLVGEMRDQATAEIGLRAAMTGHLVLSTLHTNDAITTANRLLDMGAEGYLIAATLRGIVAQRLVRRICDSCSVDYQLNQQDKTWLHNFIGEKVESIKLKIGEGCHHCNNTGYRGRIGVYELLELDDPMADALRRSDTSGFVQAARSNPNFVTLTEATLSYAEQGITSLDEVFRIAGDMEHSNT